MKNLPRALLASCLGLAAAPAMAWEWNYGPPTTSEDGYRRVHPVPACGGSFPDAGYIAIGTQDIGSFNPDVYVVYTDINGNPRWEATYDVQGLGLEDDGMAIVPVPNQGFVFLSNSLDGVWLPALTFIDCRGAVIWSQIYPDAVSGQDLWGNDLIRTATGNPAFGGAPGDLAVAGGWWNGGDIDAFLLRTDANGNLIWNVAFNDQDLDETFNALAEALPVAPEVTGDLVAVGRLATAAGDLQGLVVRASGNNGAIGPFPQCIQHHGHPASDEGYNSVTRLQSFFPGQFAFVGTTRSAGWLDDIWVARGNTCPLVAQARLGNPAGPAPTVERGHDIIEVRVAKPGTPVGSLAIAGEHTSPQLGISKGATTVLNPALLPIAGRSWLFGIASQSWETFFSLAEDPNPWPGQPGYVLAGLTWSNAGGDPQDMFLVHDDDPTIPAICEQSWSPVRVPLNWPQVNLQPTLRFPAIGFPVPVSRWYLNTGIWTCP